MNTKTITYDPALWQLVPKVATQEMCAAAHFGPNCAENPVRSSDREFWQECHRAMLAAAPSAPEQPADQSCGKYCLNGRHHPLCPMWGVKQPEPKREGLTDERVLFEAWAKSKGFQRDELDRSKLSLVNPRYFNPNTETCWEAWQARALLSSQPAAPVELCLDEGCPFYGTGATCEPKSKGCIATATRRPAGVVAYARVGRIDNQIHGLHLPGEDPELKSEHLKPLGFI